MTDIVLQRTLREWRLLAGYGSLASMEYATGIPRSQLWRWEKGINRPQRVNLAYLCEVLCIQPSQIIWTVVTA